MKKTEERKCNCCAPDQGLANEHAHQHAANQKETYLQIILSTVLLVAALIVEHVVKPHWWGGTVEVMWYLTAYLPVALPVIKQGAEEAAKKDFFNEFTLMSVATIGAMIIGEYPEGVAVMLLYTIGELLQDRAVQKARRNITALLDMRPEQVTVMRQNKWMTAAPEHVKPGELIRIKAGERVALDGVMETEVSSFDTAAITGESTPRTIRQGEEVLAGMVNTDRVADIRVTRKYKESTLARILTLVQDAAKQKAPTENVIRKFARIYTPVVFALALAIAVVPMLWAGYDWHTWVYRALIFLVISCPCALVISVPLGYFSGIGAASRKGVLFKGSFYIDKVAAVKTVVVDKTGTLTRGVFAVQSIETNGVSEEELLAMAAALEQASTHPIAKAITEYARAKKLALPHPTQIEELPGRGLRAQINGQTVVVGNAKLMDEHHATYGPAAAARPETVVMVATSGRYLGSIIIADEVKPDAAHTIGRLNAQNIKTVMLSGDKEEVVQKVARQTGVNQAYGQLLPADKLEKLSELMTPANRPTAFVGDGINDAPALMKSDIGIAMGGMGADAAIEAADIIIQTDEPAKILTAIAIGRKTRGIIRQNIVLAIAVKVVVMTLGAMGMAGMWAAVFADVGVSLLAVLNAVRIFAFKDTEKG